MILPNFLIIGAQKSGTSWMKSQLNDHPEVFIANKEIHFFDKSHNYKKGITWYAEKFKEANGFKAIGEKTPDYYWANGKSTEGHLPEVHKNIHSLLPECKLILILRNPVHRAISAVKHILFSGRLMPFYNLDELLVGEKYKLVEPHGIIEYGFYYKYLDAYFKLFPKEKMLILFYEELMAFKQENLNKVCRFLKISEYPFPNKDELINPTKDNRLQLILQYYFPIFNKHFIRQFLPEVKVRPPSRETIIKLYEAFEESNQKLESILGYIPDSWKKEKIL